MLKGEAVARADTGYRAVRRNLGAALAVGDNGLRVLEDAVGMFSLAVLNVGRLAVSCGKWDGDLVRVREQPEER